MTGGAGFIGSHIAEALVARGDEAHIVDDLSLGKKANVPRGAVLHQGSILDRQLLREAFRGATFVFHEAALPSVPRSIEDPFSSNEVNVTGTLNVLAEARDAGVEKVIFAASSSAYGDTPTLPKVESMPPNPKSPYAVTKLAGEMYCRTFHEVYGLRTTALRYFNVYGPRQDPNGAYAAVIPRWIERAKRGAPLPIYGDGTQTRDFTYVGDAVQANLLAAETKASDGAVINVGAGGRTRLLDVARTILDVTRSTSTIEHLDPRKGDIAHSQADVALATKLLGYKPSIALRDGLARTIAAHDAR